MAAQFPVALIWAEAQDLHGRWGAIGFKNQLPFSIPEDLEYFSKLTSNQVVIMGSKTWESLPNKPLPNRQNIVMSRHNSPLSKNHPPGVIITRQPKNAIIAAQNSLRRNKFPAKIWIIGGESIYEQFLNFADEAYITKVMTQVRADSYAPTLDNYWILNSIEKIQRSQSGLWFRYEHWVSLRPREESNLRPTD
ncbi:MAG: dihydrofolate reductase [Bifidobacteriaceae bacterium]|nr:dihydrofolate reductase [Bifidobacteriaceae bacterium]